mmetsp:Transcript_21109/g.42261  ORF Transcript_21109/g.42261 Transcript_21109/m.42261 type:complete len:104 (+) Transcript_21109:154-465(+)
MGRVIFQETVPNHVRRTITAPGTTTPAVVSIVESQVTFLVNAQLLLETKLATTAEMRGTFPVTAPLKLKNNYCSMTTTSLLCGNHVTSVRKIIQANKKPMEVR